MSTALARRSFLPGRTATALVAALLGVGLFAGSWTLLHHGFLARHQIIDTPVYQTYGEDMIHGQVPYRDFRPEYPPAALPTFVIPAIGHPSPDTYKQRFGWLMLGCGIAMVALMAVALAALGAGPLRLFGALAFAGVAPLALGSVVLTRFDLWPAALTVAALAALCMRRFRLGSAVLGIAVATKIYPIVIVPIAIAYAWRRVGRREGLVCLGVVFGVVAATFLPFFVLSPGGVWDSVVRQSTRPLQIESLGSALFLAAHHAAGLGITMRSSHGSQNLDGTAPNVVGALQTVLQLAALGWVWVLFARGPLGRERLVQGSAAAVCAFVALGKVLSPQFLIWLLPLVPLVRGRRGVAASALLGLACVLTQLWFPFHYWALALHFDARASWLVLARDLVLVALLAVLAWPEREPRREPGPLRSS